MSAQVDLTGLLATNLAGAWAQRANDALTVIQTAAVAPALFKPETVEQAHTDYREAAAEVARWSA